MDIKLFSLIVKKLGDTDLGNFTYKCGNVIYGFRNTGDGVWEDDGKYQYQLEEGRLMAMDKKYKEIELFNYGVSRSATRCGSYFTDYNYDYDDYEMFEIKEVLIPEKVVVIPEHIEIEHIALKIDLSNVVDEEEEEKKRVEAERLRLEKEAKAEKERLIKLYPMNNTDIIKMVTKSLKKKGITFTIKEMRREYLEIVEKKNLESKEWIEYHRGLQHE